MIEVLVYERNGKWRAVIGNVCFVDKHEGIVIDLAQNYVANLGDEPAAFYYEGQKYPFLVSTFEGK